MLYKKHFLFLFILSIFFISCEKDSDDLPAPAPLSCGNGIQDADEEGIDCGGVCGLPCDRDQILPDPTNTTPVTGGATTGGSTTGGTATSGTTTGGTTGGTTTGGTTGSGTTATSTNCPYFPLATSNTWTYLTDDIVVDTSTTILNILSSATTNGTGFNATSEFIATSSEMVNWEASCNNEIIEIPGSAFGIDDFGGTPLVIIWDFNLPIGSTYENSQILDSEPSISQITLSTNYEIISDGGGTRTISGIVYNDIFQIDANFNINFLDLVSGTEETLDSFDIQYYFARDIGVIQHLLIVTDFSGNISTQNSTLTSFNLQ